MFCPNCGREIPENSKFCTNCGKKLAVSKEPPRKEIKQKPLLISITVFLILATGVLGWLLLFNFKVELY